MQLTVEFPSVAYREGPGGVARMARAVEDMGYDQIDVFDHVVMGYDTPERPTGRYPAKMPILEALMTLSYAAAVTSRVGLGTEVLVLPQRQPVLAAKQISTLDTLSGGRVRLGVGAGWQPSEFEALGADFAERGRCLDEAITLLRTCWGEERVTHRGAHYTAIDMAMEPKPPQGSALPIWVGGNNEVAFRRVGRLGDGWLASQVTDRAFAARAFEAIRRHAEAAGRDPDRIGYQSMIASPPGAGDDTGKRFYADRDRVAARVGELKAMGFQAAAVNATAVFQAGARSVEAMIDALAALHERLRREVGPPGG